MEISEQLLKSIDEYLEEHYILEGADDGSGVSICQARKEKYQSFSDDNEAGEPLWKGSKDEVVSSDGRVLEPESLDVGSIIPDGRHQGLQDVLNNVGESFRERLLRLIDEKGLSDPEVYKRANIDRKLFSKIRCNADYRPGKRTVIALAVALELDLDETVDLLSRAEMALSPSSKADLIVEYCINNGIYDIYEINKILLKYGQAMLGQ